MLLGAIRDYEYEQRFFVGEGKGMRVTLESKWFNAEWQWFVGVARGNLSEKECLGLLSPGALDWKLGSARQVDALFEYGAEGLHMTPLPQSPRACRRDAIGSITKSAAATRPGKTCWKRRRLAMRLKDTLIVNRQELQGQRKLVVSAGGKQAALQFALFAVPNRP